MKKLMPAVLLTCALVAVLCPAAARCEDGSPAQEVVRDLREQAGHFAAEQGKRANVFLESLTVNRTLGWSVAGVLAGVGALLLFFGWALLKALFTPVAVLIGGAGSAFLGEELTYVVLPEAGANLQLGIMIAAAFLGAIVTAFFSARARPVAWWAIALAPFLIVAVLLYRLGPIGIALAVLAGAIGVAAGFVSMLYPRPVAAGCTSLLGAVSLVASSAMVARLSGFEAMENALAWFMRTGWPAAIIVFAVWVAGMNLQLTFGPSGDEIKMRGLGLHGRSNQEA